MPNEKYYVYLQVTRYIHTRVPGKEIMESGKIDNM